ncbi:dienelactone hydrolase family protein [Bradyrhizobium sp. B120]|uniref:dienelactone hydrolase family protein n=1 Tax=Bradyrhizobium sp. B120 TaxID=3410088 RepID=UPI003B986486
MHPLRTLIVTIFLSCSAAGSAAAAELVQFDGAQFLRATLGARQNIVEGIPIFPPAPRLVQGYIQRPDGPGPFPAVIVLHGCAGLGSLFDPHLAHNFWPDALTSWGYAVLVVDSFTTRGLKDTCDTDTAAYRMQDAFGALSFFSKQPYVDKDHVALLGFSAGGVATLAALRKRDTQIFEIPPGLDFKAGIAFYPCYGSSLDTAEPLLILNGEDDDWSKQSVCRTMMNLRPASATAVKLISLPNAVHGFDRPAMNPGRMAFGHWIEYNAEAARQATEAVRNFLTESLQSGR